LRESVLDDQLPRYGEEQERHLGLEDAVRCDRARAAGEEQSAGNDAHGQAESDETAISNKRAIDDLRAEIQVLRDENKMVITEVRSISGALNEDRKR